MTQLKNGQQPGLNDEWYLSEARKYCRMLPLERSVILLTCIQVIIGLENQVLVFLSVFTVFNYIFLNKNVANSEALEGVLGIQGYGPKA